MTSHPVGPAASPPPTGPPRKLPAHLQPQAPPEHSRKRLRLAAALTWLRSRVWGFVFALASDGLTTIDVNGNAVALFRRNRLPQGPVVVVANHASHADSAALAATLGRDRRPLMFAAAADYWMSALLKKLAGESLIGLWPVRRGSGGRSDLLAATELVREGLVLVVYPEGTRKTTSGSQSYKTGAFELAKAANAAVLPLAVVGTGELLPKGGGYRRTPVEVRWAEPITAAEVTSGDPRVLADRCQETIETLAQGAPTQRPGFGWARASRIAASALGLLIVFFWAYGEGISWPLVAEMPLLLLVVTCGLTWRAPLLIATSAVASVLGIFTTWWLVTHGFDPPTPLTTPNMEETAREHMRDNPGTAFWYQMFNGIPVKVYANAAGELGLDLVTLLEVVFPRALRIVIVGGAAWALSTLLARYLRPCLGAIQVYSLALFPVALALVIAYWS